jgi:4-methyl-5(b-hydroxyethyl)-thiazole monophosphate biosynthesis
MSIGGWFRRNGSHRHRRCIASGRMFGRSGIHERHAFGNQLSQNRSDRTWDPDLRDYDLLFLPGGQPGTNNLAADPRVIGIVHEYFVQNKWVTAICAAPLVLAKAGILKGKRVTSYPTEKQNEIYKDAVYLEDLVVKDGKIITSRDVGTVLDFAYTLVDALGIDSEPLKKAMLFKRNTTQN